MEVNGFGQTRKQGVVTLVSVVVVVVVVKSFFLIYVLFLSCALNINTLFTHTKYLHTHNK